MASINTKKSSSSSSTILPRSSYDVFLSFRGEDTRKNFTGHLYASLVGNGISTFKDDAQLERGGVIEAQLLQAIEISKTFVIIFSKNYAYSKWCLEELVKIIECMIGKERTVVPVFYDVDPSQVRRQSKNYGKAFAYHEKRANQEDKHKIQKWRMALTQAGNLAGYHLKNYQCESELIQDIIHDVLERNPKFLHVGNNIVGMNFGLEKLKSLINIELNNVLMVGICGIGGIGKTTLSKAIHNVISAQFEGVSFLENVRRQSKDDSGLLQLQQQLLDNILKGKNPKISNVHEGIYVIKERLQSKKVLVILDDVDNLKQLEHLAGDHHWFGPGSRIIITTRDQHLLNVHEVDAIYEVKELNHKEAIQLFSRHAFKEDLPKEHYVDLSKQIVDYTKGLPLALKILGCFLFGKTISEWESTLQKLKRKPNMEVQNVLRISFDGLDDLEKELFLDIACFFKGKNVDFVMRILDSCNFHAKIGVKVLCDRCLITCSWGIIGMHDLVQEMGREIVREKYRKEPGKWTRLWDPEDVYSVLQKETGSEAIEGILLDMATSRKIQLTNKSFKRMKNLRLLKIYWSNNHYSFTEKDYKVLLPQNFEFPSHELRYLHWDGYPLKFLPSNFVGENLIELHLQSSNIKQIWRKNKPLEELKVMDLSHSKNLIEVPNFSSMANLESLILEGCSSLRSVDGSIAVLKNLTSLNLRGCTILRSLPRSIECLESLQTLNLSNCSNLEIFPKMKRNMKHLRWLGLGGSAIKELPSSIHYLISLQHLDMNECKNLRRLSNNICRLKSLENLNLNGCSNLEAFPEIGENMKNLQYLFLCETAIKELPLSIQHLNGLRLLVLDNCKNLATLPSSICYLRSLMTVGLRNCSTLYKIPEKWDLICSGRNALKFSFLSSFSLVNGAIPFNIAASIIQISELRQPNMFSYYVLPTEELPSNLWHIDTGDCTCSEGFPSTIQGLRCSGIENTVVEESPAVADEIVQEMPISYESPFLVYGFSRFQVLSTIRCEYLRSFPARIFKLKTLQVLYLRDCPYLETFPEIMEDMEQLEELHLERTGIKNLPSSIQHLPRLRALNLIDCKELVMIPDSIYNLRFLETLNVEGCSELEKFPKKLGSAESLCFLAILNLSGCNLNDEEIPSDIFRLSSLTKLNLSRNKIRSIPALTQLCKLRYLYISHCKLLQDISELPPSLQELDAHDCTSLGTLTNSSSLLWSTLLKWLKSESLLYYWLDGRKKLVIPGSGGIPWWVQYQDMGRKAKIELPLNWYEDDHFLGVAFFFAYLQDSTSDLQCKLKFCGGSPDTSEYSDFHSDCECYRVCGGVSNGLWVSYYPKIYLWEYYEYNQFRDIQASFSGAITISSCGVHLIYSQDHQNNHTPLLDLLGTQDDEFTSQ